MTKNDDAILAAHAAIIRAIDELRTMGVQVPMSLHRAARKLHYATKVPERASQ
jgi:hypothetical protein